MHLLPKEGSHLRIREPANIIARSFRKSVHLEHFVGSSEKTVSITCMGSASREKVGWKRVRIDGQKAGPSLEV